MTVTKCDRVGIASLYARSDSSNILKLGRLAISAPALSTSHKVVTKNLFRMVFSRIPVLPSLPLRSILPFPFPLLFPSLRSGPLIQLGVLGYLSELLNGRKCIFGVFRARERRVWWLQMLFYFY